MIKNRFIHLFGRVAILCVMLSATILSLGIETPKPNFYVFYTNLSNYFCMLVVIAEIIGTIVKLNKNDILGNEDIDGGIKFAALIDILVTFLIANTILFDITSVSYWTDALNVLFHFVCPILFWLDWILFAKHNNTRWYYALEILIFPIMYIAFILIRGFILDNIIAPAEWQVVYPYFFLNVAELGYNGVGLWVFALCGGFVTFGYLICILDNIPNYKRFAEERKLRKIARKQAKAHYKKEKIENKVAKKLETKARKQAKKQAKKDEQESKIETYTAEIEAEMKAKDAQKQAKLDAVKQAKQAKIEAEIKAKEDAKQAKLNAKQAKKDYHDAKAKAKQVKKGKVVSENKTENSETKNETTETER